MLPSNNANFPGRDKDWSCLKQEKTAALPTASLTVDTITWQYGKNKNSLEFVILFTSTPDLTVYCTNQYIVITGGKDTVNNGTFRIIAIDSATYKITVETAYKGNTTHNTTAETATATITGPVDGSVVSPTTILNTAPILTGSMTSNSTNNQELFAYQYNTAGDFVFKYSGPKVQLVQIVNTDAAHDISVQFYCSLDKINWAKLPTDLNPTITHGNNYVAFLNYAFMTGLWIKMTVTNASAATYYIISKGN